MFRKLLLAGLMLLGSVGVVGGLALTEAATQASSAGANIYCHDGVGAYYPGKWGYGVLGAQNCGQPGNPFAVTLTNTCVQILTVYGWLNAPAPGNPNWDTDCNDLSAGDTPVGAGYLDSNATCLSGRFQYRTFFSNSVPQELDTASVYITC
jgi:hypothetical protein